MCTGRVPLRQAFRAERVSPEAWRDMPSRKDLPLQKLQEMARAWILPGIAARTKPGTISMETTPRLWLTGGLPAGYDQAFENKTFFINVTTVLYLSGPVGRDAGAISVSEERSSDSAAARRPRKGQECR